MRVGARVLVAVLVLVMVAMPAAAGTKTDPEVVDRCDGQVQGDHRSIQVLHESVDLCSVWFATPAPGVLDVHLTTQGSLEDRPGGLYTVRWRSGQCLPSVTVDDAFQAERPQFFTPGCGEEIHWSCPVPDVPVGCIGTHQSPDIELPANAVTVTGNEMRIRLSFTGQLAPYAAHHDKASVLTDPEAYTSLAVGHLYLYSVACTSNVEPNDSCVALNGDEAGNGRNYTVPE